MERREKQKLLEQMGDGRLPYLTPKEDKFYPLWMSKYSKLTLQEARHIPAELHQVVQKAFVTLLHHGCLFQDLVRLKGKDVLTPVSRILVGRPGCTYKYLNTRLFAVPWSSDGVNISYSTEDVSEACKAFCDLNKFLCSQTASELHKLNGKVVSPLSVRHNIPEDDGDAKYNPNAQKAGEPEEDPAEPYNVTLINYMDPLDMPYLKEEPYFGMGKMAVSWHHDENLVDGSTVAVYSYSCQDGDIGEHAEGRDPSGWHVGLKIAWDIETPGLAVPLHTGDCYFMLDDLNQTHQHCVLAGSQPRFSSTHRVAECSRGTLHYIRSRCSAALENLDTHPDTGAACLKSVETGVLREAEDIHSEVEFEWLRQFWFQGTRYSKCSDFWQVAMAELEDRWKQMETMTSLVLEQIVKDNRTEEERRAIRNCVLPPLAERRDLRNEWRARCRSKLVKSLPPDQAPHCYPYWEEGDPAMPLPFDLHRIVTRLENLAQEDD
ncbi:alpha-ketoglutarate-dependent dioxygenase FTO isoform X3 [Ascaphus truei]|uniref:alpha-ketoglutarate-dependent dioxygenase FTO isoform X3 n=1 Tax=Ascaphus truei TaxID=8439 RepID=UPI003F598F12